MGLRLAVIKHGAQNVQVDRQGKDSYRFFQAGADVMLWGSERFRRWQGQGNFVSFLMQMTREYDLVLIEGHASTPVPCLWFRPRGEEVPSALQERVLETLVPKKVDVDAVCSLLLSYLRTKWLKTAVWGCVLIGGKSSRMGTPKHLIEQNGQTWLERTVATLGPKVDQVVLSGRGEVPQSLQHLARLADIPGLAGPLSGILAALRWQTRVSWLVTACDLPDLEEGALDWLLQSRAPGVWATLPDLLGNGRVEPLLAHYDYRSSTALENLAASGELRLSNLAGTRGVITPQPPRELRRCWRNVNAPSEMTNNG